MECFTCFVTRAGLEYHDQQLFSEQTATGNCEQCEEARHRDADGRSVSVTMPHAVYISDRALPPEGSIIQAIESLLSIPAVSHLSEEQFCEEYASVDGLVTDPSFAPSLTSLYPNPDLPPASALQHVTWRRVAGALYLPTGKLPRLLQGALDNHAFLGALAAVACKQELLLDLIVSDNEAAHGVYTLQVSASVAEAVAQCPKSDQSLIWQLLLLLLQFYKHGSWQKVLIDNYLPVEDDDRLAFACSGHVGELWPSYLEKAYAKLHGSYYGLEGGSVCDCLVDLTGGVACKIALDNPSSPTDQLWLQLLGWLSAGGVVVCRAKVREGGDATAAGAVLANHLYSVTDMRELDKGRTQLLRVHCPWPTVGSPWHGAWASGSPEWGSSRDAQALAAELAAGQQDEAVFWMSFSDFTTVFNRLYVCRLFPPCWHCLTLHCGWHGPSAGGPYMTRVTANGAEPYPSSTWCCNPQFRLTVRKAGEVVLCLGQQDPRIEARGHVKKRARRRRFGLQLLKLPPTFLGRRWEVKPQDVFKEISLTAGREASLTFMAEPDAAYVLVPHTGAAGEEAAFILRCFSSTPLELEQLPSPLSLVLGGQWAGHLAGGPPSSPTFGSNPQYMVSCQQRTQAVISVSRLDVKYAVLKPAMRPEHAVGLYLCFPEKLGPEGQAGRKTIIRHDGEVHAQAAPSSNEEAVMLVTLEPETAYVLIPCLGTAGLEAPFELRLMSAVPLQLVPLPEVKSSVLQGEWRHETAGGCDLHPSWRKNPRYLLCLSQQTRTRISLMRSRQGHSVATPRRRSAGVQDMIGFYIIRAADEQGTLKGELRSLVLAESTFVTTDDNVLEYDLQGGQPFVIIPCTYAPGRIGHFTLAVQAAHDFDLIALT
ncbi:hypothetical protein QJQ45_024188 [Haematococcus lacustris]|nr:hypothetical protein QJQ45_024188 [Haematococcus lacustris]